MAFVIAGMIGGSAGSPRPVGGLLVFRKWTSISFGAWFMAVVHHRVLDELRRRGTGRVAAEAIEQLLVEAEDPAADPALQASARARNAALLVA